MLRWTPGFFAAEFANPGDSPNSAAPGRYRLRVTAGDGSASASRDIDIVVRNINQAPRLLPLPLQLTQEGQTLSFTVRAADGDNDAVQLALLYDASTPAGVNFDANTGTFEWTPGADVVNNAGADSRAFSFSFGASDGTAITQRTVQVRVLDVNRPPEISVASHALRVGESFSLPVLRSASATPAYDGALRINDADGAAQTQGLVVSFNHLPEGAV